MTNEELIEAGLSSVPAIILPSPVRVAAGKGYKQVQHFGKGSARLVKDALKAKNPALKGKALAKQVNEVLNGEKSLREQLGVAFVQACIQSGKVPSHGEITKGGAKLIFVNATPVVEAVTVENDYENMSTDDIADLLHKLEAILDAKVEKDEAIDV